MTKPSDCANLAPAPTSALFNLQITHSHCHPTQPLKPSAENPSVATYSHLFLSPNSGVRAKDNLTCFLQSRPLVQVCLLIWYSLMKGAWVVRTVGSESSQTKACSCNEHINDVGMDLHICPFCFTVYSEEQTREMKYLKSLYGLWRATQP